MSGTGIGGILIILGSIWWAIMNRRLWRDPSKLHPGHWMYSGVYSYVRRWQWPPKKGELTREEIKKQALGSMFVGILGIVIGLFLLVEFLWLE